MDYIASARILFSANIRKNVELSNLYLDMACECEDTELSELYLDQAESYAQLARLEESLRKAYK